MDQGTIVGTIAIVISVGGAIITAINHTRIRSACCGKLAEISLDIDKTSPKKPIEIKVPE